MRAVTIIIVFGILLTGLIIAVAWPAIMAGIGAVIGFLSLKKLRTASTTGEKILYGGLTALSAFIILTHLKGVMVVGAIIYFLTSQNLHSKSKRKDTFDYPYHKK